MSVHRQAALVRGKTASCPPWMSGTRRAKGVACKTLSCPGVMSRCQTTLLPPWARLRVTAGTWTIPAPDDAPSSMDGATCHPRHLDDPGSGDDGRMGC